LPVVSVAIQLTISEPMRVTRTIQYEFIVVNSQTTTSAFHKVV